MITVQTGALFNPVADADVNSTKPTNNYGSSSALRTDASPTIQSYLRFDVTNLVGPVVRATLRLYAETSNPIGFNVHGVANTTWAESGITYANRPSLGPVATSSGASLGGSYVEVDVTSLVGGNGPLSLALVSNSSTAVRYSSRQASNQPELFVTTSAHLQSPSSVPIPSSATTSARLGASQTRALAERTPPRIRHVRVDSAPG